MSLQCVTAEEAIRIRVVRGCAVILDSELAVLYGVQTKLLNRAVKRNAARFPRDFAFRLRRDEFAALRCQIGTSNARGGRRYLPWVFTEHGAIMAANVLNSERAVAMSVYVVRAFVRLREQGVGDAALRRRLTSIEKRLTGHDNALRVLFDKIRSLLLPAVEKPRREIGFHTMLSPEKTVPRDRWRSTRPKRR